MPTQAKADARALLVGVAPANASESSPRVRLRKRTLGELLVGRRVARLARSVALSCVAMSVHKFLKDGEKSFGIRRKIFAKFSNRVWQANMVAPVALGAAFAATARPLRPRRCRCRCRIAASTARSAGLARRQQWRRRWFSVCVRVCVRARMTPMTPSAQDCRSACSRYLRALSCRIRSLAFAASQLASEKTVSVLVQLLPLAHTRRDDKTRATSSLAYTTN